MSVQALEKALEPSKVGWVHSPTTGNSYSCSRHSLPRNALRLLLRIGGARCIGRIGRRRTGLRRIGLRHRPPPPHRAAAQPPSATSAAPLRKLDALAERLVFPVEDVERRQADVGDFLLIENEHGRRCGSCNGPFAVGATAADAPPAIVNDTPAAPNMGRAVLRRFRFAGCFA